MNGPSCLCDSRWEAGGAYLGAHRAGESPGSRPKWLLNQRRSEGLGGLESQPSFTLGRSPLQVPGDQNEPAGPGGRCWRVNVARDP